LFVFLNGWALLDLIATEWFRLLYKIIFLLYCAYSFVILAGISYGTDEHSLRDAFASYGQVIEGTHPFFFYICSLLDLYKVFLMLRENNAALFFS